MNLKLKLFSSVILSLVFIVGIISFLIVYEKESPYKIYEPCKLKADINDICSMNEATQVDLMIFKDFNITKSSLNDTFLNESCPMLKKDAWACGKYLVIKK